MKAAQQLTNLSSKAEFILQAEMPQQSSATAATSKADREIVNYIFGRLVVLHPAWKTAVSGDVKKWAVKYREELLRSLVRHKLCTEEHIERGLAAAETQDSDFLPNPGRFASWCKPKRSHPSHQLFDASKALEQLPASKEVAIRFLNEMRAGL